MPEITSTAEFAATIRRLELVDGRGWEDLARTSSNAAALAKELVRTGALTAFQTGEVLAGRGEDLVVGSFVLLDLLGAGGMGQVFKARHKLMGRTVALKLIHPDHARDRKAVARFQQEMQAAAKLSHPNIVQAYHAEYVPRGFYLAMEFCDGRDLERVVVAADGGLPVGLACECIAQAAEGLSAAHAAGLVHRDIKPSNLLLTTEGTVKILDFGLVRLQEAEHAGRLTREGAMIGTPDFIAPEQARDATAVDIRGDIYSLGCTLHYLLTGQVPFPGGTPWSKVFRHQSESPTPASELRPEVPAALTAIVRKMTARDPAGRYQTPAEVVAALAPFRQRMPLPSLRLAAAAHAGRASSFIPSTQNLPAPGSADLPRTVAAPVQPPRPPAADTVARSESETFGGLESPVETSPAGNRLRRKWLLLGAVAVLLAAVVVFATWPRGGAPSGPNVNEKQQDPPSPPPGQKPPEQVQLPGSLPSSPGGDDAALDDLGVLRVAFHPADSNLLAAARGRNWEPYGGVELWSVSPRSRRVLAGGRSHQPVHAVAFSRDGAYLAFAEGSYDVDIAQATVFVYETKTWTRRQQFKTASDGVQGLAFAPGSHRYLVVGTQMRRAKSTGDGGIEIWDGGPDWSKAKRVGERKVLSGPIVSVAVNPTKDKFEFATAGADRTVRRWAVETAGSEPRLVGGDPLPTGMRISVVDNVAWSADGRWLAAVTNIYGLPGDPGPHVLLWDLTKPGSAPVASEHGTNFTSVAFLPDGSGVVAGDASGYLSVWGLPDLKQRGQNLRPLYGWAHGLAFSPDGRTLAVGGEGQKSTFKVDFLPVQSLLGK